MIQKKPWAGLLCVASLLMVCTATFAAEPIVVRFINPQGEVIQDVGVSVYSFAGEPILKLAPASDGRYFVDPNLAGEMLLFQVDDPGLGQFNQMDAHMPQQVGGEAVDVTFPPQTQGGAPPNDLCENAEPIPSVPGLVSGDTATATISNEDLAPGCGPAVTAPGVWYTVVGTGNPMTASVCSNNSNGSSNFDDKITVYCDDCDNLQCLGGTCTSAACGSPDFHSTVNWESQAGATYRILVHGFGAAVGQFTLEVFDGNTGDTQGQDAQCLPTGACCSSLSPPFNCSVETADMCAAIGGDYQGDGTNCESVAGNPQNFVSMPNLSIPDADPAGVNDTITVPNDFVIGDVNVDLIIVHTFQGDLIVTLTHAGQTVTVWDRNCGGFDDIDAIFDDEGAAVACSSPTTGVINPETTSGDLLAAFDGLSAAGDWTLNVSDNAGLDLGTLIQWSLQIDEPGAPTCPDPPICGNGILEPGEDCDDGNNIDGDGCSANCCIEGGGGGGDDENEDENGDDEAGDGSAGQVEVETGQEGLGTDHLLAPTAASSEQDSTTSQAAEPEANAGDRRVKRRQHRGL